jgi:hypothetical protein
MGRIGDFLLNDQDSAPVPTQAFSITKILTIFAPIVTAAAAALTASIKNLVFTETQVVSLLVSVLLLLAVLGAADVVARGRIESAKRSADSAVHVAKTQAESALRVAESEAASARTLAQSAPAPPATWVRFTSPIAASLGRNGRGHRIRIDGVKVLGASDGRYLCIHDTDNELTWEPANRVTFKN